MKKILFFTALAFVVSTYTAQAQIRVGAHANFIMSSMKFDADDEEDEVESIEDYIKARPSFKIGLTASIPVGSMFAFMPQLNYVSGGAKLKGEETFEDEEEGETVTGKITGTFKPSYLELPLNFTYSKSLTNGGRFFAGVGPSISMGLGGKYKMEIKVDSEEFPFGMDVESDIKFDGKKEGDLSDTDEDIHFKRFQFGANALVGYQLANGLFAQATVNHGFSNLSPDEGGTIKACHFGIGIGYFFK